MSTEAQFYDLSPDTTDAVTALIDKMALPFNIKHKIVGNTKLKKLIKLQKTSDINQYLTSIDLIIMINEDYYIALEEKNTEILIAQELDRIQFDIAKGSFKLAKFELQTNSGILKKYGIDAVAEANQISDAYKQQKADKDKDAEPFDINSQDIKDKIKSKKSKNVEFLN